MSRTVCGECWMPYGGNGECGCPPEKPAMTCAELADELTAPIGKSGQSTHAICEQAAVTLRRQHEAIKVLRRTLTQIADYVGDSNPPSNINVLAKKALADTEEYK